MERETGVVIFYAADKGFGFVCPSGTSETDEAQHLYINGFAVRRAGIASLEKGDLITYRREVSKYAGRKNECQQIELIEKATP
jgi:cold shock CspA family protein